MTYDGAILARARTALDAERARNQAETVRRTEFIYRLVPEIEEIDRRMRGQMAELVRLTLSKRPDLAERIDALREENLDLQIRRAELLTAHGYPVDYLDEIVSCPLCRDSGWRDGALCSCMQKRYNQELTGELSTLLQNGDECFEHFDLSYYSDTPDQQTGGSHRERMTAVLAACRKFAQNFPNVSSNLLLRGDTGLGKTYLSACIARVVAEKGFSVCYDTAVSALDAFDRQKFARDAAEAEKAALRVRRMLSCDLMILDDLGTEMVTPMSLSALYTLLNTRLTEGRRLVISTNCGDEELARRYTPQICSRIHGEFLALPFYGTDIRQLKRQK